MRRYGVMNQHSWQYRITCFYVRAAGVTTDLSIGNNTDGGFLTKFPMKFSMFMIGPICIFGFIQAIGIVTRLHSNQFTLHEIFVPLEYATIITCDLVGIYTLVGKKSAISEILKNTARMRPSSSLEMIERAIWRQKYSTSYDYLLVLCVGLIHVVGISATIVSPMVRIALQSEKLTYAVLPVWYPIDVTSNQAIFLCTLIFEIFLFWFTVFSYAVIDTVFLYIVMTTRMKFDALSQFLEGVQLHSMYSTEDDKGKVRYNEPFSETGYESCRSFTSYFSEIRGRKQSIDLSIWKLRVGMKDWEKLCRQSRGIQEIFSVFLTAASTVILLTNVIMAYAAATEIRNSDKSPLKAVTESFMYMYFIAASLGHLYVISYTANLLEDTHEDLKISLWKSNWLKETLEYKKLLLNFQQPLNNPFMLRAFSFHPVNLRTFLHNVSKSFTYFLFLLQLQAQSSENMNLRKFCR